MIDIENTVVDVENTLIDVEKQIDTISFLQVPKLGEQIYIPPLLQTPANEEKNENRTREEGSSSAMETTDEQFEISSLMPTHKPQILPQQSPHHDFAAGP